MTDPDTDSDELKVFDGTNWKATIPWLVHIERVAKKTGFNPLEIGMSKWKGMDLCGINIIGKEGNFTYLWFHQLFTEHYSNILYSSDAISAYVYLTQ